MGSVIRLFAKKGFTIFFILLEIVAIVLIFRQNAIQQSFIAGQTAALDSRISGYIDEGTSYLKLREINENLVAQNKDLMTELYGRDKMTVPRIVNVDDTKKNQQLFTIIDAEVISNSINRADNYFTINRGANNGVTKELGVITPKGIAGIVINATPRYALVQSILSRHKIKISASLKKDGYFGTLTWKGDDSRLMHLSDIPKYVPLAIGDTVVTDGKSSLFPKGILVGRIASFDVDPKTGFWDISVELSQTMGNLQTAYVVKNIKKEQLQQIQDTLKKAKNGK